MIYVDTNILISYINPRDRMHREAVSLINEYRTTSLLTSIITLTELYAVYSRIMDLDDVELEALVLYTLEKTSVVEKDLDLEKLFKNAVMYANKVKLKTLDLLHLTAAKLLDCKIFLTFDKDIVERADIIKSILDIEVKH